MTGFLQATLTILIILIAVLMILVGINDQSQRNEICPEECNRPIDQTELLNPNEFPLDNRKKCAKLTAPHADDKQSPATNRTLNSPYTRANASLVNLGVTILGTCIVGFIFAYAYAMKLYSAEKDRSKGILKRFFDALYSAFSNWIVFIAPTSGIFILGIVMSLQVSRPTKTKYFEKPDRNATICTKDCLYCANVFPWEDKGKFSWWKNRDDWAWTQLAFCFVGLTLWLVVTLRYFQPVGPPKGFWKYQNVLYILLLGLNGYFITKALFANDRDNDSEASQVVIAIFLWINVAVIAICLIAITFFPNSALYKSFMNKPPNPVGHLLHIQNV